MPYEQTTPLQHPREFLNHAGIIARVGEESERREKIHYRVESSIPSGGHSPHVTPRIPERRACPSFPRNPEEMIGVIESIDSIACFRKKMSVPPLAAWNVENSRARWKTEDFHQPRDLMAVALEREYGLVLEKIMGVEIRLPPFLRLTCHCFSLRSQSPL
jgi:hypothetical protein